MNVLVMAVIDLHSLWSWKRLQTPALLQAIHMARKFISEQRKQRILQAYASKDGPKDGRQQQPQGVAAQHTPGSGSGSGASIMHVPSPPAPAKRITGKQEDSDELSLRYALLRQVQQQRRDESGRRRQAAAPPPGTGSVPGCGVRKRPSQKSPAAKARASSASSRPRSKARTTQ